jgi:hypothetical protein
MYEKLNDTHKQILSLLVKSVRSEEIPEEFTVLWAGPGAPAIPTTDPQKTLAIPRLSGLVLDVLADADLIFSRPSHYTRATPSGSHITQNTFERSRACHITQAGFRAVDSNFSPIMDMNVQRPPVEITESLARFRLDFPDSTRLAFVMMQFSKSPAHQKILSGVRTALDPHGLVALRADDKQYHDDLCFNILTYIYGSRFGIAVFERIEAEAFNPNVSLEVGYMLALGKSVCFLKDRTLRTLHTDLVGKLYRSFDPQNPEESIPPELFAWMDQKGFIVRHSQ